MKNLTTLIRWASVFILAGTGHMAFCQTTAPAETKEANPAVTTEDQDATKAVENLLKFYKSYLNSVSEQLKDEDVEPAVEAKAPKGQSQNTDAPAEPASTGSSKGEQGPLRTGHLEIGHIQAGALPLTLPDVPPTQRPSIEYEGTMFQKAIYDKALSDRYKFFHDRQSK
jgi:hypothetical protein